MRCFTTQRQIKNCNLASWEITRLNIKKKWYKWERRTSRKHIFLKFMCSLNPSDKVPSLKGQAPGFDVSFNCRSHRLTWFSPYALHSPHGFTHLHTEYISSPLILACEMRWSFFFFRKEAFHGEITLKPWTRWRFLKSALKYWHQIKEKEALHSFFWLLFFRSHLVCTSVCVLTTWALII